MEKLNFIVFGKNKPILDVVVRLLNADENWAAVGFVNEEEAFDTLNWLDFQILLLTSGIEEAEELAIRERAKERNVTLKIIQHYGGGSGLLKNEILHALHDQDHLDTL